MFDDYSGYAKNFFVLRKCNAIRMPGPEFGLMFGSYIDTERVECFSEGVFSIVATIVIT